MRWVDVAKTEAAAHRLMVQQGYAPQPPLRPTTLRLDSWRCRSRAKRDATYPTCDVEMFGVMHSG
ncbi:MAG: hypothetical protein RJA70_2768 [Pseudomonadota bacterium]|jgi:hypothetical protein